MQRRTRFSNPTPAYLVQPLVRLHFLFESETVVYKNIYKLKSCSYLRVLLRVYYVLRVSAGMTGFVGMDLLEC